MNPNHIGTRWLVTGPSGSGKSTLARRLASQWRNTVATVIFDPDGHWSTELQEAPCTTPKDVALAVAAGRPVCYRPPDGVLSRVAFPGFCRWAVNIGEVLNGTKLIVVDEIQKYQTTGKGGLNYWLEFLADDGRKRECDLLLVSQAPNRIHDVLRGQLTGTFTFRFNDRLPLRWLEELGFDSEEVRRLPQFAWQARFTDGTTANSGRKGRA